MQWFPACYANLATVNQTVTNITVTMQRARVCARWRQKGHARKLQERQDTFQGSSSCELMSNYPN